MNKTVKITALLIVVCQLISCAPAIGGKFRVVQDHLYDKMTRVAVIPFEIDDKVDDRTAGDTMANLLAAEMITVYQVVERDQINSLLKTLGFELGGAVSESTLPQIGKMLGVQAAVLGNIFEWDTHGKAGRRVYYISANIRMVDVQTGALIWSVNCKLEHGAHNMHDFAEIYAQKFVKKLQCEMRRHRY